MIKIFGIELKMFFIISTWGYCIVPEDLLTDQSDLRMDSHWRFCWKTKRYLRWPVDDICESMTGWPWPKQTFSLHPPEHPKFQQCMSQQILYQVAWPSV